MEFLLSIREKHINKKKKQKKNQKQTKQTKKIPVLKRVSSSCPNQPASRGDHPPKTVLSKKIKKIETPIPSWGGAIACFS
jgi:hypothetical protein